MKALRTVVTACSTLYLAACSAGDGTTITDPPPVSTGSAVVHFRTTGSGSDPDGVTLSLLVPPGSSVPPPQQVAAGGSATFRDLPPGTYTAVPTDLSGLCASPAPVSFSVNANRVSEATVVADCVGGFFFLARSPATGGFTLHHIDSVGAQRQLSPGSRTSPVDIAPDGNAITGLRWTYDGQGRLEDLQPVIVSVDGTVTALARPAGDQRRPLWSPKGDVILGSARKGAAGDVVTLFDPRTGEELTPAMVRQGTALYPFWSPDGGRIAFSALDSLRAFDRATDSTAFVYAVGRGTVNPLGWSPDGRYLAIEAFPDGTRRIEVVDLVARSLVASFPASFPHPQAAWHPSENRLAYTSADGSSGYAIWLFDAGGGSSTAVVRGVNGSATAVWSADGRQILFGGDAIAVLDVATGATRVVIDEPNLEYYGLRWARGSGPREPNY